MKYQGRHRSIIELAPKHVRSFDRRVIRKGPVGPHGLVWSLPARNRSPQPLLT